MNNRMRQIVLGIRRTMAQRCQSSRILSRATTAMLVSMLIAAAGLLPIVNSGASRLSAATGLFTYKPLTAAALHQQVQAIMDKLTTAEKIHLLAGDGSMATRSIPAAGIPKINMSDATVGVRVYGPSPAYPASIALAATWNRKLAFAEGTGLGRDARARGVNIILGPGMDIVREPQCGRNFEYVGEDPYLAGAMVVPWIQGLQRQGVAACAKHFAVNEQETNRFTINMIVSMRALREIYLPPFRDAVRRGRVWCLMAAYNKVNGNYCTASHFLLTNELRQEWGFKGVLMSDWGATHDTLGPMTAGMDLEMPDNKYYNYAAISALVKSGQITQQQIDTHVRRIIRMMVAMDFLRQKAWKPQLSLNPAADHALIRRVEAQAVVLLKNTKHVLPLAPAAGKTIVVVGPMATPAVTGGGGSSYVDPNIYPVSMLAAIRAQAGPGVHVVHIPYRHVLSEFWGMGAVTTANGKPGFTGYYYPNRQFIGRPAMVRIDPRIGYNWGAVLPLRGLTNGHFSVRWLGVIKPVKTADYLFTTCSDDGCRVFINGREIIGTWKPGNARYVAADVALQAGATYRVRVDYYNNAGDAQMEFGFLPAARAFFKSAELAEIKHAGAVIACMGFGPRYEGEGADRTWRLPTPQDSFLRVLGSLNPHTVVVINAGAGIAMHRWIHRVAGLLYAWYPGENGNTSVAKILFGKIDPSGHLPVSIPKRWKDDSAYHHFPGSFGNVHLSEGIFVGYRWFDHTHIAPRYCFGDGLTYTSFALSHLKITAAGTGLSRIITARVSVRNTGKMAGAQVVEFYIRPPVTPGVPRCYQNLKGFVRVKLAPGAAKTVQVQFHPRAFAYYDTRAFAWRVAPGSYGIAAGFSSRNTPVVGHVSW